MKLISILLIVLVATVFIAGCKDSSDRYYGKPQGSQQAAAPQNGQQYPVGAGCGVAAPADDVGVAANIASAVAA